MIKTFKVILILQVLAIQAFAQIGGGHMEKMNALLRQYGGDNAVPIKYEPQFGLVHQTILGYADHYTISDIKQILVIKAPAGATVQFNCDNTDPCINHIGANAKGKYLSGITYYFSNEIAANTFAALAVEIIEKDFKRKAAIEYSMNEFMQKVPVKKVPTSAPKTEQQSFLSIESDEESALPVKTAETTKPKKKVDHLSMNTYTDVEETDIPATLNPFGKQLISILQLAQRHELAKIRGQETASVSQAKIKLPKAKKNYINTYKGEDCFIAEFGTMQYYEDLEEKYTEIKDEIEAALPDSYEPKDMAESEVYEKSDNEVYHTEYYHTENPTMPSIVIRIAPDGKGHTLFLRIGKP